MLEKILDMHIKEQILATNPIPMHPNQLAYQKDKSCEVACSWGLKDLEVRTRTQRTVDGSSAGKKVPSVILKLVTGILEDCCGTNGLNINSLKINACIFTNRKKEAIKLPWIHGFQQIPRKEVKCLRIILDHKLKWNSHEINTINEASKGL